MARRGTHRWLIVLLVVLLLIGGALAAGIHYAGRILKDQILANLGPESEVGAIDLGLSTVSIRDLRIKAPSGWPADETLRAARIDIAPDWRALLSRRIEMSSIRVEGAYLSILRAPNGKLRLLPSLLEKAEKKDPKETRAVSIGEVALSQASLDFFDATIKRPPHRIHLENVEAKLTDLQLPELNGDSKLSLQGQIKGAGNHPDGSFALKGNIRLANLDSDLATTLRSVDLIALQPYLIKAANTGVKQGTLDVDAKSTIKNRHLHAPGVVTLHNLELDTSGSGFMGLPREAAVGAMKDKKDNIEVKFALEGNLDDPQFSINDNLAMRFGGGLADALGVSISTLGKSVGSAASGVGGVLKNIFGGSKE